LQGRSQRYKCGRKIFPKGADAATTARGQTLQLLAQFAGTAVKRATLPVTAQSLRRSSLDRAEAVGGDRADEETAEAEEMEGVAAAVAGARLVIGMVPEL